MIFVTFVERRTNPFFIYFGRVARRLADTLFNTKQYFYFLAARYYIWSCKTKEVIPKIGRFPNFLSSLEPLESKTSK